MGKYHCEKCGKEFKQKSHYTTHLNKKNPCVVDGKIQEMIDNAVKERIIEIKKAYPTELTDMIEVPYDNTTVKNISPKKISIPKPILKWVGGKTQIIDKLIVDFPTEINNYHEIFLGGASVLFTLLSYVKSGVIKIHGNIYAHDLNEPLIYIYKNIQSHHNELYDKLQDIIVEYNGCGNGELNRKPINIQQAKLLKENYYYWIRSEYNKLSFNEKKSIIGSSMFIFLNKTCFRGLFRVGPNGFNVPYGHYQNPTIINKEHLEEIHNLIQNVIFECSDFNTSLTNVEPNDFVYLDPPYAPETDTSFVGYTVNGFNIDHHNKLFSLIHQLTDSNKKIMLSNADVSLVRENFTNDKYNTTSILCRRTINSKNPDAKTKEVIIKNY
jgi:DNA adenine methylase|tara:strand:+ start:8551 stop:9696 length:1146 start_codon:yes stop_codon:yes gene_type:complete